MKNLINIFLAALILLFFTSCNREADTIPASQTNTGYVDTSSGTTNLEVKAVYPVDESTSVSRSASIVVVFSKPVNTATVTSNTDVVLSGMTLNPPTFSADNTIATFTPVSQLSNNTAYTVTVNSSMTAADGGVMTTYVPPTAPAGHNFTTIDSDAEATDAIPVVLAATRYPAGTVSRSTDYVELTFSEEMDPLTIAFNIGGSIGGVLADTVTNPPSGITTSDNRTFRLDLDNSTVDYNEVITITLQPGITSAAAVALNYDGNHTWNFTVVADPDTTAGVDSIGSIWVTNVTDTQTQINWTTNREISGSTVSYGLNSNVISTSVPEGTANIVHSITLTLLTDATRYYFRVNSGAATSAIGYFMTKGDGTPVNNIELSTEPGNKTNLNVIRNTGTGGAFDGSSFVTWENGVNVKASYFDNDAAGTLQWGGVNGTILDNTGKSNSRTFIDSRGSLIVTMESGGNIYLKKVEDNGAGVMNFSGYDWGTGAASTGSMISMMGSNPHISIVWADPNAINADAGTFTVQRVPNTSVVLPAGNWFYDFDVDFTATVPVVTALTGGDVLLNLTTLALSNVTADGTAFRHALNQNSANISSGINYVIGNHLSTDSFIARDHTLSGGSVYSNGSSLVYSEHGYTLFGSLDLNDIIYNSTQLKGGRYTANTQLNNNIALESSSTNAIRLNHLIDGQADFLALLGAIPVDSYARNIDPASPQFNQYALITAVDAVTKTDLTLAGDLFPNGDEDYEIVQIQTLVAWGSATVGTAGTSLEDTLNYFSGGISAGNVVINTTNGKMTYVLSVAANTLTLVDAIFATNDGYEIWTGSSLGTGTAGAVKTLHLIDGSVIDGPHPNGFSDYTATHVVRTTGRLYAAITSTTDIDLTLDTDIFTAAGQSYDLLSIGASIVSGTNSLVSSGELVDNTVNFIGTPLGSYVLNTTPTVLTLTTVSDVIAHILTLDDNIFVSGNGFSLRTGTASLAAGPVDLFAPNGPNFQITDSTTGGLDFNSLGLDIGGGNAYARNPVTFEITPIVSIDGATKITVTDSIFTTGLSTYEVFNIDGAATTGTADATVASQLVENDANLKSITTGTSSYAIMTTLPLPNKATRINGVIARILSLGHDIFVGVPPESYDVLAGTSEHVGGVSAVRLNFLIDAGFDFTSVAGLGIGDYVRNTSDNSFTSIAVFPPVAADKDQLKLDANIFPLGNEGYELIDKGTLITSGVNTGAMASQIVDDGTYFPGVTALNFVAINISTVPYTMARITGVAGNVLTLDASIFASGDNYEIRSGTLLYTGVSSALKNFHLVDGSKTLWASPAYDDYLVRNNGTGFYSYVISAVPTDLTLADDIFNDIFTVGNDAYSIYSDYCLTHYVASQALDTFYRFNLNAADNVGTDDGDIITIYDRIVDGTADPLPANPLLDDDITLDFTAITANNDYVFNTTSGDIAQVNVVTYARGIGLTADIFSINGNGYTILRTTPYVLPGDVITSGITDSTTADQLTDTGIGVGVTKGDLVYNVTDQTYAAVIDVNANNLVITNDIFSIGEGYIIIAANDRVSRTGINSTIGVTLTDASGDFLNALSIVKVGDVVRNNSSGAQTIITAVTATTLTLQSATVFPGAGARYVILQPRVLVAFEHVNGGFTEIYGEYLRLNDGSNCGIIVPVYTGSIAGNIQTAPDNNGNSFIFYEVGVNIHAKRYNAAGTDLDGYPTTAPGLFVAAGSLINVLPDGAGGIYILYENGVNIYLVRKDSSLANVWAPVAVSAGGADSAFALDAGNQPIVAYAELATGHVRVSKYLPATGAAIYNAMPVNTLTIGTYGTYYRNTDDHKSNIAVVSDGLNGVVISWVDTRFMSQVGFTLHALAVDGAGSPYPAWDANSGGIPADYNGIKIGIIDSDLDSGLAFKALNYNDGAGEWSARFIWQDYRAGLSDLYYDNFTY